MMIIQGVARVDNFHDLSSLYILKLFQLKISRVLNMFLQNPFEFSRTGNAESSTSMLLLKELMVKKFTNINITINTLIKSYTPLRL